MLANILAILVAASSSNAAPSVSSSAVTRARAQLHTPDEIAPAVLPYLACLYSVRGLPLLRGTDGVQVKFSNTGDDCLTQRRLASAGALKLLKGKSLAGGGTAEAYVEEALVEMDRYVASLPVHQKGTASRAPAIVGLPVTIEDEVQPAYARYDDCLKTQVSETGVTAATVVTIFRQAMTICRGVRDSAVQQAREALASKGWDATARAQAAENTFQKVDESWVAMGQQFQDSLNARVSSVGTAKKHTKAQ